MNGIEQAIRPLPSDWRQVVARAYCTWREHDHTTPDDVLDLMRDILYAAASPIPQAAQPEQAAPGVPEGWTSDPDSIPKDIINACRDAIRREFGNNGTDGYYKRILAKVFKATLAAAPVATVRDVVDAQRVRDEALTPKWEGEFSSFSQWVIHAKHALSSPSHRPAVCIDAIGRRCTIGKDFMTARDEGTFPVRYFWEFEQSQPAIAQKDAEDARRYRRLVESGDFVPSILGGWALRVLTEDRATKEALDAAVDGDVAHKDSHE